MTDQDPTQRYEAPPVDQLSAGEAPAPTAPVATAPAEAATSGGGGGRLRWIAAGVVTLAVVGTAAAATMMLTSDSGDPDVLAWAPADSIMYAELRLDLPGDQRAKLAEVMSAFPGFDDQAAFDTKLGEALDQLVGKATDGKHNYRTEIDPWFGGQLSLTVGPVPADPEPENVRALLLAGTTDGAKATAWADSLVTESGASTATEQYGGVTITTVTPPPDAAPEGAEGMTLAHAVLGPVLAVGDVASVKAAIDTKGTDGLADDEQFREAEASVTGDRLGFMYLDSLALMDASKAMSEASGQAAIELPAFFDDLQAPWLAMAMRADGDAFRFETRSPHVDKLGPAKSAESKIASLVPPTTVLLATGHDFGEGLDTLRSLAADDPELADGVKQVEDALAIVGGFDAVAGWMGDVGLAVTRDGQAVAGGLVVTPTDGDAAEKLFTQLKGFITLAGGQSGIEVSDEDYGGTTITSVTIENIGSLLAGEITGGASNGPDIPNDIVIAYAVTDEVVTLGYTSDFVKAVLDARDGESLADAARFSAMLDRADKAHGSLSWIDVAGFRELVEGFIPADERGEYDTDIKPYLQAFDAVISTSVPGDDLDRGTMILVVSDQ